MDPEIDTVTAPSRKRWHNVVPGECNTSLDLNQGASGHELTAFRFVPHLRWDGEAPFGSKSAMGRSVDCVRGASASLAPRWIHWPGDSAWMRGNAAVGSVSKWFLFVGETV
ncbi:hypothetical protein VPH35_106906 [Triticum aestivum]|uniref:Uncharacterized protein n=1 Tax=Triticum urartu TaxID=4572 RepID=A0A8R7UYV3_TRIUA